MSRDTSADLAALIHPLPDLPDDPHDIDGYDATREQIVQDRTQTAEQLRLAADEDDADPVLAVLTTLRQERERAERLTRQVFAYGLEFAGRNRRAYTLAELADAAGYRSPSGVATAYDHHDIAEVADQTGTRPRRRADSPDPGPDPRRVEQLLHDMQQRGPATASSRVMEVYYLLINDGWTPHPPEPRAPGTKAAKRYVRWVREWPHGTRVALYQEPAGYLAASGKVSDEDPRRFSVDYTDPEHGIDYVTDQFVAFTTRVNQADQSKTRKEAAV